MRSQIQTTDTVNHNNYNSIGKNKRNIGITDADDQEDNQGYDDYKSPQQNK